MSSAMESHDSRDTKNGETKENGETKDSHKRSERRRSRSRDRRRSRSRDRRRSRSRDRGRRRRSRSRDRRRRRSRDRDRSRSVDSEADMTPSQRREKRELEDLTRDARTVFVSQLQVKATERDLKKFFKTVCKVKDVVLIRDRNSGKSKGFGYIEVKTLEDVPAALMLNGQQFIFRNGKKGFPVMVKASEAEKNFTWHAEKKAAALSGEQPAAAVPDGSSGFLPGTGTNNVPLGGGAAAAQQRANAVLAMAGLPPGPAPGASGAGVTNLTGTINDPMNRLYVGNLHINIGETELRSIFEPFGKIMTVSMQLDGAGRSKGFAFIHYEAPEPAAAALKELDGMDLAGMVLKVGRVNNTGSGTKAPDAQEWSLDHDNAQEGRHGGGGVQLNANSRAALMAKLAGGAGLELISQARPGGGSVPGLPQASQYSGSTAQLQALEFQARQPVSSGPAPITGMLSMHIVIKNMFDPATETEAGWHLDIAEDTQEECSKHGRVLHCAVDQNSAGFCYVSFADTHSAAKAAQAMHGRWFAERMIMVEYLTAEAYRAKWPGTV